jgi:hypothetical protein
MPLAMAKNYRIRALELRAIANYAITEDARSRFESLADQYDRMADRVEASLPPHPPAELH